jgi:hypothetical protein
LSCVPIWTFDYLHSVAVNLCQMAVSTERDAMSFWDKADSGSLTRLQLTQNIAQSRAEREAAQRQVDAAQEELGIYVAGQAVAKQRAADARANAADYAAKTAAWSMHQALSAQLGGGAKGNAGELNRDWRSMNPSFLTAAARSSNVTAGAPPRRADRILCRPSDPHSRSLTSPRPTVLLQPDNM